MKLTKTQLKQMIQEAASEYVWGVKNPGRVANKYKISVLKQIILEELEAVLDEEEEVEEEKKYMPSFYTAKEKRAKNLKKKGVPPNVAFGVADKQMAKAGKKKRKRNENLEITT